MDGLRKNDANKVDLGEYVAATVTPRWPVSSSARTTGSSKNGRRGWRQTGSGGGSVGAAVTAVGLVVERAYPSRP